MNEKNFVRMQPSINQGPLPDFAAGDWIKPWRASVRTADFAAEIRTEYFPNISLEHYHYKNMLCGDKLSKQILQK
jgi:hypothetical protein